MIWSEQSVQRALGLPETGARPAVRFSSIATDTRTLGPGALFVAIRGERFDGHQFLEAARKRGAAGAVVMDGTPELPGLALYHVPDTVRALGALAHARRRRVTGPVVAITGTNGKTSTKEMVAAILRTRFHTAATPGNLNNLIGVPLTILGAPDGTEALVVEAGASVPGEIARYRTIAAPDIAVITMVAPGHLEGFGSREAVLREKVSLTEGVALAVVGSEPPALAAAVAKVAGSVVQAGLVPPGLVPDRIQIGPDGHATLRVDGVQFRLGVPGRHQAANAMLAWAVGRAVGVDPVAAAEALAQVTIPGGRSAIRTAGGLTILDDSYNANPGSFRAALDLLNDLRGEPARRTVIVAGGMRELGAESAALHREVAGWLRQGQPDLLAVVGEMAEGLAALGPPPRGRVEVSAPDADAIAPLVASHLRGDELILVKASRGVALERILPVLTRTPARTD